MQTSLSKIENYPAFLNAAWLEHLAPRADDAPSFISTFAGTGGSSLGYSMAGFNEVFAVEWEDHAAENFRLNFPHVDLYQGDITNLAAAEIFERTKLKKGDLDVFDGSPPCQGFSTTGKRNFDDSRNFLFLQFVRLLKELMPKCFQMENVSGMVKGKMKLLFAEILKTLKAAGYKVKAVLMNAKYFGVPQSRERMIFVGVRNDLSAEPSHPKAEYHPVNLRQAVGGIDSVGVPLEGNLVEMGKYSRPGEDFAEARRRMGLSNSYFSTIKLDWEKPVPTICKLMTPKMCGLVHPDEENMLSIEALKRCASFPDEFILNGDVRRQWARIGNSVPPLLMKAIAENIKQNILNQA